jgi:hypothetical protein
MLRAFALPNTSCAIWSTAAVKAPVAQLDRATVYGTVGWRFEPVRVHASGAMTYAFEPEADGVHCTATVPPMPFREQLVQPAWSAF